MQQGEMKMTCTHPSVREENDETSVHIDQGASIYHPPRERAALSLKDKKSTYNYEI